MSWQAKPSQGYAMYSSEGIQNIEQIHYLLAVARYTIEAQAGTVGNMVNESGLNPWRWEGDTVNYNAGYGLFQYTEATDYFNLSYLPYFAPNTSTSSVVAGALPSDGHCQMDVFTQDILGKWHDNPLYGWSDTDVYNIVSQACEDFGNGLPLPDGRITQAQYSRITDVQAAAVVFLCCFERPSFTNLSNTWRSRVADANTAYAIIQTLPPGPTPVHSGKMPLWMMCKPYWKR